MPPARARGFCFVPRPRRRARRARGAAALPRLSGVAGRALRAAPAPTGAEKRHASWRQLLSWVYSRRRPRWGIRNYSRTTAGAGGAGSSLPSRPGGGGAGRVDEPLSPPPPPAAPRPAALCSAAGRAGLRGTSLRLLAAPRPALPGGLQRRRRRRRRRRPRTLAPVCLSRRVQAFKFPALSAPSPWKPLTLSALPPPSSSPQTTTPPPTSPPPRSWSGTGSRGSLLRSPRRRRWRLRQRPGLCPAGPRCPGKPTVRLPAGAHRRRRRRRRQQRWRRRRRRRWRLAEAVSL
nr:serine/arginine repetitive matrix protein 3-like [Manis javanica]